MTILNKLTTLLTGKYPGVRKDGLVQLARSLALQCSSAEEAEALVAKLDDDKVNDFVKEYRSVVDKEVSDAGKKIEATLKSKYKIDDNEPNPNPKEGEGGAGGKTEPNKSEDIATIIANAIEKQVKPLQERLQSYEQSEVSKSRLQQLEAKLSTCKDDTFKAQTLKDYARMSFADDNAFAEYLTEKEADINSANQRLADSKLGDSAFAPLIGGHNETGVSQAVQDYVASQKPEGNAFAGKEL